MAPKLIKEQQQTTFENLKGSHGWNNVMQTPKIEKVVISVGVGKMAKEKGKFELVQNRLAKITGQKPVTRGAKKAIATFKTRIGDTVGYQVTLRGKRAEDFLNRLVHVALPRTKDFRGLSDSGIDEMGNFTIGIKENTVFPETSEEELKDVFGIGVTIVTTAKDKKTAKAYFTHLGFPFKK
jgi:large subunit ribosomal protein L5